jgi:hypothetical protein
MSDGERTEGSPDAYDIGLGDLIRLRRHQLAKRRPPDDQADKEYAKALNDFLKGHEGLETGVSVFADSGLGAYLTPTGTFQWVVMEQAIKFDWSKANQMLYRLDENAERAREWWPHLTGPADEDEEKAEPTPPHSRQSTGASSPKRFSERKRGRRGPRQTWRARWQAWRERRRTQRNDSERQPHLERAFLLLTGLFAAIDRENTCHPTETKRRKQDECIEAPTELHLSNLRMLADEITRAEFRLRVAAQRNAQTYYGYGMIIGTLLVAALCAGLAVAFKAHGVSASMGVALPAGALGALVSVLQRMTSGTLKLDFNAGRPLLMLFGIFRPLIGAIFGMVLFALFKAEVLPGVAGSDKEPLAFFAGLGFLAGFNERFAQDTLAGSAKLLSPAQDSTTTTTHDPLHR